MIGTPNSRRRRVTKSSEERSEDLLRAALAVFSEKGVDGTSIGDITDRATVAKGTFYLYFKSKDQVVSALWERHVNGLLEITAAALTGAGEPGVERIIGLLDALIRHAFGNAELHRLVYGSADAAALELCRASNEKLIDALANEVSAGTRAGTLPTGLPDQTARFIFQGAHGTLHDLFMSGRAMNQEAMIASIGIFVRRLLRA